MQADSEHPSPLGIAHAPQMSRPQVPLDIVEAKLSILFRQRKTKVAHYPPTNPECSSRGQLYIAQVSRRQMAQSTLQRQCCPFLVPGKFHRRVFACLLYTSDAA